MVDQGVRERTVACGTMLMAFATVVGASAQQSVDIPGGNRLLELDAQQVYSVGSIAGADWETFGEVGSVAFDGYTVRRLCS